MKWLQRLQVLEESQDRAGGNLTRLTKAPSVSFVSAGSGVLQDFEDHHRVGPGADKAEVRRDQTAWDAEEWRGYFDEKAAIAEHDGGQSRTDAEALALAVCIAKWMNEHAPPPTRPENGCVHCHKPMPEFDALPFLTRGGHCWLHSSCHKPWIARLQAGATAALAAIGIVGAGDAV